MKVLKEHYRRKFILDEGIILEGIDDVRPYYPNIDDDKFNQLIALDPTFKDGKDKLGTYGKWILNLYDKKRLKDEDFYKVTEYLTEFERKRKNFKNKDIGQFKTLPDLADALAEVEDAVPTERQVRRNSTKNKECDVVFDDDQFTVYIPKTYGASRELGGDTHWCTASSDDYYYNWYTEEGPLYIIISKNDTNNKWQVHFPSGQCMNASDRPTDLVEVCKKDSSLLNFLTKVATDYLSENGIDANTDMVLDMTKVDTDALVSAWKRGKYYNSYNSREELSEEILRAFFDYTAHNSPDALFDIVTDWAINDLGYYERDTRRGMSFRKGVLEKWAEENNISIEDAKALIRGDYDEVDSVIDTDRFDDDIQGILMSTIEDSYYDDVVSYIGSRLARGLSEVTDWGLDDYNFSKIPVIASNDSNNIINMALSYGQGTWDGDSFEVTGNPIYDTLLQKWGEKSDLTAPYYGFDRYIDEEEILAELSVYSR